MTTPMFTPDGRLLQVEYASLAASHSSPLLAVRLVLNTNNNNHHDDDNKEEEEECLMILMTRKRSRRGQDRLVLVAPPSNQNSLLLLQQQDQSLSSLSTVVIAMSGVLSDSVALLQQLEEELEDYQRLYGGIHSSTHKISGRRVADRIASACQSHAFGGGLRPYGSTMLVCSVESSSSSSGVVDCRRTDPSGAVMAKAIPNDATMTIVGGTELQQELLRKQLEPKLVQLQQQQQQSDSSSTTEASTESSSSSSSRTNTMLLKTLQIMGRSLCKPPYDDNSSSTNKEKSNNNEKMWLECVILSPSRGVYKLTDAHIQRLMEEIQEEKDDDNY